MGLSRALEGDEVAQSGGLVEVEVIFCEWRAGRVGSAAAASTAASDDGSDPRWVGQQWEQELDEVVTKSSRWSGVC